ncbi:peroxiredoxin [Allosphingosinicella flava]|uniref:thioredoxin-dependent peroxiredoxin n=1 Tax=Allosphingosinicella flava TaxID=2771430 RepID=A0A7T2LLX6_9SPHN|nr:peroxiredoxin [Sphingosinicella flava]QPQ54487.1 peroxiredoxin [Sphingosinicella flava]
MRPLIAFIAAVTIAAPAFASLSVGAKAPDFQTYAALAGKVRTLKLSDELKKGPVVLYFFPAAFTPGCTLEAHEFAEASDDFRKMGAQVIGLSADPIDKLSKFSREACRDKFAVASAGPSLIAKYDVKLPAREGLSNRTSYVIAPDGRVTYVHSDMNPRDHVKNTLAAVREWKAARR